MTNDLGVWTADDCALVLIDYQNEMFEVMGFGDSSARLRRPPPTPETTLGKERP
jgi:hypothetical protein